VKNVLAAESCELQTRGRRVHLSDPHIVTDESKGWAPLPIKFILTLLQNDQTLPYIAWGLPASVGVRILIIWLYNNTGKSVFAAVLFHVMALFSSSFVATSAGGPIIAITVVIVTFLWGSRTLARYRYKPRHE
jgi:hypothetical protein